MLDFTSIRRIVEETFSNNFSACPVKFENTTLPKAVGKAPKEYIAIFDNPAYSDSTGMGETTYLNAGIVIIQIFTPINTGTERSRAIAQLISDFLSSQSIEGMEFGTPELHPAPKNDSWYQQNLNIPYTVVMGQPFSC